MTTRETSRTIVRSRNSFALIGLFLIMAAVVAVPFYSARSSSLSRASQPSSKSRTSAKPGIGSRAVSSLTRLNSASSLFNPVGPAPQPFAEGIATFANDCTTAQTDFNLGDVVCTKASGVPVTVFPWHVLWIDTAGFVRQADDAVADDQHEYRYTLPATATSDVNGQTVNNLGTWKVNLTRSNGAVRQTARFVVHQPASPSSDVFVQKFVHSSSGSVSAGENISFTLVVGNAGPDGATVVHLIDSAPTGASLVQFTQNSGPACLPAGSADCTIATMANGDTAEFTAIYNTGAMAPGDYDTSATVSSTTPDPDTSNNSSTASFTVTPSNGTTDCQLICPENINATANTTEGGQRGAHVTYQEAVSSGTCGAISSVPASGSFFPVGQTVVNATSETGNGACSFTITVTDNGTNPPTIACPANKTADANGDCEATVVLGTPTTSGDNVTVVGSRSDGKPMYNCDINGNNCTRKNPDLPFSAGVTTVTWTATSHDAQGNEEGNASCQQTVTVNDTTPPVITATNQTASADVNCQAAVPDYSNQVADNCACASNDNSQDCVGQHRITTTQDVAAGTLVGPGTYTIHLTANDGSSNNGGAGNTTTKDVTFTVNDTTAPTITCPASVTTDTEPGTCSAHVNPGTATATDNCDSGPTIVGTRSDGQPLSATYPKGTTTITWTATDHATPANSSTCAQTITVNDHENPMISCPANITAGTDPNSCSAIVNPGNPTASDNCGSPSVAGVRSDGQALNSPYPKGTTTITWTATDSSGNRSSCNQTITVNDTQPPAISCTADIVADFDPAVNGAVVTYTAPVGTDNCPGATTVQIAGLASGSTFPSGTTTNTFKVTDGAGLTATCSFKVTVALTSLIGLDSVTITGSGYADSYSSAGGYPASKSSLANVLSNGTITMGNSAKVWGNVRSTRAGVAMSGSSQVTGNATAGTTVTTSGSASVGGTRTNNALAPVMTLPSVPACGPPYSSASGITGTYSYNASTGDLSLSGVNIATLANGNYCFHNVTLGNSTQLQVNGLVVIKMTGTLNTSGASNLNNTTQIPSNLRILSSYSGSNGVVIGNSVSVYAVIYTPNTGLNLSGAAPLFGTFEGKSLIIGSSGAIHYDTQLKSVWPAIWTLIFGP